MESKHSAEEIKPETTEKCPACNGVGNFNQNVICTRCDGSGWIEAQSAPKGLCEELDLLVNRLNYAIGDDKKARQRRLITDFVKSVASIAWDACNEYTKRERWGVSFNPHPDKETFLKQLLNDNNHENTT